MTRRALSPVPAPVEVPQPDLLDLRTRVRAVVCVDGEPTFHTGIVIGRSLGIPIRYDVRADSGRHFGDLTRSALRVLAVPAPADVISLSDLIAAERAEIEAKVGRHG